MEPAMDETPRFVDERAEGETAATLLRTTLAVRERCGQLLARAREGRSTWFEVDEQALARASREAQPRLRRLSAARGLPAWGLWRDIDAGGQARHAALERTLAALPPGERTHARIDLTVVAWALASAPAPGWSYTEAATGQVLDGEAGLAVAILHAFIAGLFSSDPQRPWQADARGLRGVVTDHLALALQVRAANPLADLASCAIRLRRLGEWMCEQPEVFGDPGRPAGLFDIIISPYGHGIPHTADVHAHDILSQCLVTLSGLWPETPRLGGVPLGDCWPHPAVQGPGPSQGWVPLHSGMQQLTASLLRPFAWGGVAVRGLESLTAAATMPIAHWCLQQGLLQLRDPQAARATFEWGDEVIVEWRALTVALLGEMAARCQRLPVWLVPALGCGHPAGQTDRGIAVASLPP